jgi:hypothetical protein
MNKKRRQQDRAIKTLLRNTHPKQKHTTTSTTSTTSNNQHNPHNPHNQHNQHNQHQHNPN